MKNIRLALIAASCILFSCQQKDDKPAKDILADNMDTTIAPGDDFFDYANGAWVKKNAIPGEESAWGIGNLVIEENLKRLKTINEDAAKKSAAKGSTDQKIGDFWKAAMDSASIEKKQLTDLKPWLDKINGITNLQQFALVNNELNKLGIGTLTGMFVTQDDKNSDVMALKFWQYGLYLPEREYYLKTDSTSKNIIGRFQQLMTSFLSMSGYDTATAKKEAASILAMETKLAVAHRKLADLRDPYRNYNKMPLTALYKLAPSLALDNYTQIVGVTNIDSVIVGQPEYYTAVEKVLKATPVTSLKAMLQFRLLDELTEALPDTFGNVKFNFAKLLSGATVRKPRWKRVLRNEENSMGELLGQLFVKQYFNETAKKRYEDLVESIRGALKTRISKLDWMSDTTKQKAYVKLAAMKKKVGYPDKWKDFSSLNITADSYLQNLLNANEFWLKYNINKLGKPVDRDEWEMTPQTYNAYYNPSNNEIVLPAGIFTVPGYLDEQLDDALVYGYAGASTIGHEITHGFDDEGRQFDEKGNLKSWWTKTDEDKFKQRADVMAKQFDNYVVVDTFKINGRATLGENIADLGGILLGWDAFQQTEQFKKNEKVGGVEPAKRYFMGYALGWLGHTRQEALRNQVLTDVHSPAKFRVNGPFADVDAFYSTFNVKPGNKLFIADTARVRIW
jgi:putative endopeptidase